MEEETGSRGTLRHSQKKPPARELQEDRERKGGLLPQINAKPNNATSLIVLSGVLRNLGAKSKCEEHRVQSPRDCHPHLKKSLHVLCAYRLPGPPRNEWELTSNSRASS